MLLNHSLMSQKVLARFGVHDLSLSETHPDQYPNWNPNFLCDIYIYQSQDFNPIVKNLRRCRVDGPPSELNIPAALSLSLFLAPFRLFFFFFFLRFCLGSGGRWEKSVVMMFCKAGDLPTNAWHSKLRLRFEPTVPGARSVDQHPARKTWAETEPN